MWRKHLDSHDIAVGPLQVNPVQSIVAILLDTSTEPTGDLEVRVIRINEQVQCAWQCQEEFPPKVEHKKQDTVAGDAIITWTISGHIQVIYILASTMCTVHGSVHVPSRLFAHAGIWFCNTCCPDPAVHVYISSVENQVKCSACITCIGCPNHLS